MEITLCSSLVRILIEAKVSDRIAVCVGGTVSGDSFTGGLHAGLKAGLLSGGTGGVLGGIGAVKNNLNFLTGKPTAGYQHPGLASSSDIQATKNKFWKTHAANTQTPTSIEAGPIAWNESINAYGMGRRDRFWAQNPGAGWDEQWGFIPGPSPGHITPVYPESYLIGGGGAFKAASALPKLKWLRVSGGKINGFTISKGAGYGAKPRLDFHKLGRASKASNSLTVPKLLQNRKILHYHRGLGNNLRRYRPWEKGWNDKNFWSRF